MTPSFPHVVKGTGEQPDQMFYDQWQSSPVADEYLAKMPLSVAESAGSAAMPGPNLIAIGFSATHGSGYQYDTHVPVLLFGKGIAAGEYLEMAAPTDVAPTLAFLAGVTLPRASGRVLTEALSRSPGAPRKPGSAML